VTSSLWPLWASAGSQYIFPVGYLFLVGLPLVVTWAQVGVLPAAAGVMGLWMHSLQVSSLPAPERAFVLAWSTLLLHSCSLGPCSLPQQIAHWMPLLFGYWPSPCSFCAECFSSPSPTGGASTWLLCLALQQHSVLMLIWGPIGSTNLQTFLRVFCYITHFSSGRVLLFTASGAWDVFPEPSTFP
jgi:hypothetical protein